MHFSRYDPCLWNKLKLRGEGLDALIQMVSHVVFIRNQVHTHKMVDSLVSLHFWDFVWVNDSVSPANIPVFSVFTSDLPVKELFWDFSDNVISTVLIRNTYLWLRHRLFYLSFSTFVSLCVLQLIFEMTFRLLFLQVSHFISVLKQHRLLPY